MDEQPTLSDDEIVTTTATPALSADDADTSDTGDDAGDDTGDDTGDVSDTTDTGDDSGDDADVA
jgi:hypothetical protein